MYGKKGTVFDHGSSPRVWGTLILNAFDLLRVRFIPTGVGNARLGRHNRISIPVHPHGCGERNPHLIRVLVLHGSSPRVWGTHRLKCYIDLVRRFIPTGVGNAYWPITRNWLKPVHPHGCGERISEADRNLLNAGSSPRVWGTRDFTGNRGNVWRFIPTGVGNAYAWHLHSFLLAVHPHGCGERQ